MEKMVYCYFGERCKKLYFVKCENMSDAECIRKGLKEACKKDESLNDLIQGNFVVLQIMDEYIKKWCDLEPLDEVKHLSEINVIVQQASVLNVNNTSTVPAVIEGFQLLENVLKLFNVRSVIVQNVHISQRKRSIFLFTVTADYTR